MTSGTHGEEFRRLFAQEAELRLASLGNHLLQLEEAGNDDELIASVFRDAHNLKGGAAVVGFDDVARVAHAMEDLLEQVRSAARGVTPALVDVLLAATDGLTSIVPAILDGQDRAADADTLERRLRAFSSAHNSPTGDSDGALTRKPSPSAAALPTGRDGDTLMMVPLSQLDELLRLVGESVSASLRLGRLMSERWKSDPGTVPEFRDLSRALSDLREGTTRARMVPISTITDSLHRAVRDLARSLGKNVRWEVRGAETELDRSVLQQLADPLLHLVRNAVDHAVESPAERLEAGKPAQATLLLQVVQLGSEVLIEISDDGRGIDLHGVREEAAARGTDVSRMGDEESLRLVFESGFSTAQVISDVSGRGVGLDAARAGVEAVRGRIEVQSSPGQGTQFRIVVPITLAVLSCLMVEAGQERYAVPMHLVVVAQAASTVGSDSDAPGRPTVWVGDSQLPMSGLARTLWDDDRADSGEVVVVVGATRRHAFLVDRLIGQRDVVVKDLGLLLSGLDTFAGASVEPDGSILLVLDVAGLVARARRGRAAVPAERALPVATVGRPTPVRGSVLVVDDAALVRQTERFILEGAGYHVRTANDGVEALASLAEAPCDLVVTDVEMPRMDGFALTEAIRVDPDLVGTRVLIVTSRVSDESRRRGLEVGADGHIVKSAFDETGLLRAVSHVLARRAGSRS